MIRPAALTALALSLSFPISGVAYNLAARDSSFGGAVPGCSTGSRPGDCAIAFDSNNSTRKDQAIAILETSAGEYVMVGEVALPNQDTMIGTGLVKLDQNGAPIDPLGGRVTHDQGFIEITDATIDPSDRVLVAGRMNWHWPEMDIGVSRFTLQGSIDQSFGDAGMVTINCGDFYEFVSSISATPQGGVLVLVHHSVGGGEPGTGFCAVELSATGEQIAKRTVHDDDTAGMYDYVTDVDASSKTYLQQTRCSADTCDAGDTVALRKWASSAQDGGAIAGPFALEGCGFETMGVQTSAVTSPTSRLLVLHGRTLEDGGFQGYAVATLEPQRVQIYCGEEQNRIPQKILAHGPDAILFDNGTGNGDGTVRVQEYKLQAGELVADEAFNGGDPLLLDVLGNNLQNNWTAIARWVPTRAAVAWVKTAAIPGGEKIIIAASRTYSAEDTDFAAIRIGNDETIFRSGFEEPVVD